MKYSSYKKGSSALRRIINDEELMYSRHFGIFNFALRDNGRGRTLRGIYNAKTDNVIAFINARGNVFMRPNSIYFDKISSTKNKVIKHNDLRNFRGRVNSRVKSNVKYNMLAEQAIDNLKANKDKENKVYLFTIKHGEGTDTHFIQGRIRELLSEKRLEKKLTNTKYALENSSFEIEETLQSYKLYFNIKDYAKEIERKEYEELVKKEVANALIENVREIAQEALLGRSGLNPLQFTHEMGDKTITGTINLSRIDMWYPESLPIREWLNEDYVARYITFHEPLGSLESRGIDEMAQEDQRSRMADMQARMVDYATAAVPGGIYRYSRTPSSIWSETTTDYYTAADSAFGSIEVPPMQTVVAPPLEIDDVTRAVEELPNW